MRLAITPAMMERINEIVIMHTPLSIAMSRGGNASSIAYFPASHHSLADRGFDAEKGAQLVSERIAISLDLLIFS